MTPMSRGRAGPRDADDRDLLRRLAQRDPEPEPSRVDRDVASEMADRRSPENAAAHDVQHDHLAALGVGHVGVAAVRMARRIAGLAEAAEDAGDLERLAANEGDRTELGVGDDRRAADRLDAARLRKRRHVAPNPSAAEVDGDEPRLEIRGDERNLSAEVELRERSGRKDERRGPGDECASVHDPNTREPAAEVPLPGAASRLRRLRLHLRPRSRRRHRSSPVGRAPSRSPRRGR